MEIKLYYFDIPFWRAEVTRLALFLGDIPFTDCRIKKEEYVIFKSEGRLPNNIIAPFKQLPVLEVDGKIFSQTGAIARYCGKLSGLYPIKNDIEAANVDQVIEAAQDINFMVTLSNRDKEFQKKKIAREILATKHLPKWFNFLENLIHSNKQSIWFVGQNMTIADLAIWRLLGWLKSGMLDGIPTSILDNFPNLNIMREEIYQHPKIKEWMIKNYGKNI